MAGEYQTYKDANGVTWTILNVQRSMAATVKDDAEPRYDPPPDDMMVTKPNLDDSATTAQVAERDRRSFSNLREQVDKWAGDHQQQVILSVKPDKDKPVAAASTAGDSWWVVALLVGLVIAYE